MGVSDQDEELFDEAQLITVCFNRLEPECLWVELSSPPLGHLQRMKPPCASPDGESYWMPRSHEMASPVGTEAGAQQTHWSCWREGPHDMGPPLAGACL
eukprot:5113803-Amphidinium_carterae.1